jgi:V/A-type H+-transporting ATPase subunit F
MKLLVIGNQDAVWGFGLAGVHGQIVNTTEALNDALDTALHDSDVGIILITEDVTELAPQRIHTLMAKSTIPLVVEIPGPGGPDPERLPLGEMIRRTIGVRL